MSTNRAERQREFLRLKRAVYTSHKNHCRDIFGKETKLADTAWKIATSRPEDEPFLHGKEMGDPESYNRLSRAAREALNIFDAIRLLHIMYHRGFLVETLTFASETGETETHWYFSKGLPRFIVPKNLPTFADKIRRFGESVLEYLGLRTHNTTQPTPRQPK